MMNEIMTSQPSWLNVLKFTGLGVALILVVILFVTYAILAERKVMAFMQMRPGPNRIGGKLGILQTLADVLKLLLKENITPKSADKLLFLVAPVIAFAPAFMVMAVIPFSENVTFANLNVGVLYYVGISGLSIIGIVAAGWASNNKYSLLGGMRAAAQMISYEIPLVLSLLGVILLTGSMNLNDIIKAQDNVWYIFTQPIAFVIFFIAAIAELNRGPFDLVEAESELVGGFSTEYTGFRWAIFMLAEYFYLFAMSSLITVLFLGGWQPVMFLGFIPGSVWFALKFLFVVFLFLWIRFTFPRIRADQLMELGWKVLLPLALANVFITAIIKEIFFR
ncbi:MAG: NADH:ubiquinone oxidoreductase subunit [Bacillales bacterium]|jgi:NADH-quinone oxidoreductase subunit H|nr:NADH:ubiquinone oxidoreductase subunit [Bacillales bacterium]